MTLSLLNYLSPDPYAKNVLTRDEDGKLLNLELYYYDITGDEASILIYKKAPGVYDVNVRESIPTGTFIAHGTVDVLDDGEFRVNGELNGMLHDQYGDCFDIYPGVYKHFFGLPLDFDLDVHFHMESAEAEAESELWKWLPGVDRR